MQTVIIDSRYRREQAHKLIDAAPVGAVMTVSPPKRTVDQNAKLWAAISDVSRAMPQGRKHPPETWKALFCHAAGYEVQFEMGLNGKPFPVGYRTSRMTKAEMSDLLEFVLQWGAENGVTFGDEARAA
jgi:hypothetical protein